MRESPPAGSGGMMNGAVYISFFQGQLESVLERVVQLAVQEISKTVGSSLNALLLEAAAKEQENRPLRLQLQARESRGRAGSRPAEGEGSASDRKAGEEPAAPEQRLPRPQQHAPGGQDPQPRGPTDTRRLQQRGRIVDQLRAVMEHVLSVAVRELTKIVEASFDDLLLEITKMEAEQQELGQRLGRTPCRGGGAGGGAGGLRRGPGPVSEDARAQLPELPCPKEEAGSQDPEPLPVLSVSQDWTPVLDKVFGQRGSEDVREQEARGGGGRSLYDGSDLQAPPPSASPLALEPTPSSPQQDPCWTPLENMEVFSPDDGPTGNQARPGGGASREGAGSSGRRSSASMLHRLLTLPSQLMDEEHEAAVAGETQAAPAGHHNNQGPSSPAAWVKEEEEEEEEEEDGRDKGRKKRRRLWSECGDCGQRFSRRSLLKAHRQSHATQNAPAGASGSPPPHDGPAAAPRCPPCGKRAACRATTGSSSGWTCRIRPDQNQNP